MNKRSKVRKTVQIVSMLLGILLASAGSMGGPRLNPLEPIVKITPTSLTFNDVVGEGDPPPQTFTLQNAGSGSMSFGIVSSNSTLVSPSVGGGIIAGGVSIPVLVFAINPNVVGTLTATITIYSVDAPNSPQSLTLTVNTTSANVPALVELVLDGSFESGNLCYWNDVSTPSIITSARAVQGRRSLLLGGPESSSSVPVKGAYSIVYPIKVPAQSSRATLSFDYFTFSDGFSQSDLQGIYIGLPTLSGNLLTFFSERRNERTWKRATIDLTPFRGTVCTINFAVTQRIDFGRTGMYVDNLSVAVEEPTPLPGELDVGVFPDPIPRRQDANGFNWGFWYYITNAGLASATLQSVSLDYFDIAGRPVGGVYLDGAQVVQRFARCGVGTVTMAPRATVFSGFEVRLPNNLTQGFVRITAQGTRGNDLTFGAVTVKLLPGSADAGDGLAPQPEPPND